MIFATVVTIAGLALVVYALATEDPLPDVAPRAADRGAPGRHAGGHAGVLGPDPVAPADVGHLADLPLRRVPFGYDRGATRALTGALAAVYAELAREVDPVTLARAWARARTAHLAAGRDPSGPGPAVGPVTGPAAGVHDGHDGMPGAAGPDRWAGEPGAGRDATGEGTRDDR